MADERTESLIEEFAPLVEEIASQLGDGSVPEEDLVQEGYLGLLEAARLLTSEDPCEVPLSVSETVEEHIREAVRRALERGSRTLESDERLVAQVELLDQSIDRLTEELGSRPNIDEIANDMQISQEKVLEILKLTGESMDDSSFFPNP